MSQSSSPIGPFNNSSGASQNIPSPVDLEQGLWNMLMKGVEDRKHPFHTPVLSTVNSNGEPVSRIVVLRCSDQSERIVACHTDRRSLKIEHVKYNPIVSWIFYHADLKIQIRICGIACPAEKDSEENISAWRRTTSMGRVCYSAPIAPSTVIDEWTPNLPQNYMELANKKIIAVDDIPPETFVYFATKVRSAELLKLHHDGHQRIRFNYDSEGEWAHQWIAS